MIKVENKKIIAGIANKSFKANKLRNLFSVVAIILTTVMFTTLFTIGMSMVDSMEESVMRQVGGSSHGGFKYLSEAEFNQLKKHPLIKEIEYSIPIGTSENLELKKRPTEIRYGTDKQAHWMFAKPTMGRMPEKYNEIAMDTIVLDALGISHELGQKINLEYTFNNHEINEDFILTGYWEGDRVIPASQIWISKEYLESRLEGFTPDKTKDLIGTISMDVMFRNTWGVENKIEKVIVESGYAKNEIDYGVNWAYMSSSDSMNWGGVLAVIAAIALIMFCGYLIIFNIFYISVSRDIRFYGLLKTIGTTSRQIKQIIRKQALKLCLVGIPIGLVLGYGIGVLMTPIVLGQINIAAANIAINPIIFIGSAVFAIITVLISTKRPAKIAGKVSPIEALRNTDGDTNSSKKSKRSTQVNVRRMAANNVFRNRKKVAIVTLSLSLSLIILNATYSMVKGFDMDLFLSNRIVTDFAVADTGYFNVYIGYEGKQTLSQQVIDEITLQPGIEQIGHIRFTESLQEMNEKLRNNIEELVVDFPDYFTGYRKDEVLADLDRGSIGTHVYGMDEIVIDNLSIFEGKIDREQLSTGNYIIVSAFDEFGERKYYEVGDKVNLTLPNGYTKEYEVMAIANIPHNLSVRHGHVLSIDFYLPNEEFIAEMGETEPMLTVFNVADHYENEIENFMVNYCETINTDLNYESKATYEAEFESMQNTYKVVGYILSLIIGFIGVMNFVNTIMTSIIARRREFAMLQSIGMTTEQLLTMLIWEGVTYITLAIGFVLTIGIVINSVLVQAIAGSIWFFSYQLSILPVVICIPVMYILAIVIPIGCHQLANKESIVERLREC